MGKKKRSGGGRRNKGRGTGKDRSSQDEDGQGLLSEELTALSAIFQEDFRIVSESPHVQFAVNLRPHSNETGDENSAVSAVLSVRCLPGYPYKCPKLQILPEKGLTKDDVDRLLSLLIDQANFNAREGRVMIFNLVEAAQEFLSDITPNEESQISHLGSGRRENWSSEDGEFVHSRYVASDGTFVHGLYDLYSDMSGSSWDQIIEKHVVNDGQSKTPREKIVPGDNVQRGMVKGSARAESLHKKQVMETKLSVFQEEDQSEESLSGEISESELMRVGPKSGSNKDTSEKRLELDEQMDNLCFHDSGSMTEPLESSAAESIDDDKSESEKKDLILVHFLRILSASKMSFSSTEIASELFSLGILSEWGKDLVNEPTMFDRAFENAFRHSMTSSPISQFWKVTLDVNNVTVSGLKSRYLNDFEELCPLGHGGFGHVVLCKNKLDGRHYAVKKIRLKDKSLSVNDKILREVATLSRLQHQHIVRYYQAWFETGVGGYHTWGSMTPDGSSFSHVDPGSTSSIGPGSTQEMTFLYIQMEYCPRY